MDATGLTSGTVYPALDKLESLGYLTSRWEDPRAARRDKRRSSSKCRSSGWPADS